MAYRIAVTGGPCAGKTTVMKALKDALQRDGWIVSVVPEAATILLAAGAYLVGNNDHETAMLQVNLFRVQRELETAVELGMYGEHRRVILIDRGLIDNKAYMSGLMWSKILGTFGVSEEEILKRYDAVMHLQSAACGAEEHYVRNDVRRETVEQARVLEQKTRDAWKDHQLWSITKNADDGFSGKVQRAVAAARHMLKVLDGEENFLG